MSTTGASRPLTDLLGGFANDIASLLRKEVQLAKAEVTEKLGDTMAGMQMLVIGLVLALGALGVLLAALVSYIAGLLINAGMSAPNAHALGWLAVGVVAAIAALVMIGRGRAALNRANPKPERADNALARDAAAVKERP